MTLDRAKLTKTMLCRNLVYFPPMQEAEAAYIQRRLFAMGIYWIIGGDRVQNLKECAAGGITVQKGRIYYGRDEKKSPLIRSIHDFRDADPADWQEPYQKLSQVQVQKPAMVEAPRVQFGRAAETAKAPPRRKRAEGGQLADLQARVANLEAKLDRALTLLEQLPAPRAKRAPR